MIVITGAAGFIGSVLTGKLIAEGFDNLCVVDDYSHDEKNKNLVNKKTSQVIDRDDFLEWFDKNNSEVSFVLHIGARTDTTEFNVDIFNILNLNYSKQVWERCTDYNIPLIYASSAATYGLGEYGYNDDHDIVSKLKPLNPYGESKNDFDKWALKQTKKPPFWAGLKFFNVYGPKEDHKEDMRSVINKAYDQIIETGKLNLFRSHRDDYADGEQERDFVYVKDAVAVTLFLHDNPEVSGIFNCGTGSARTWLDLGKAIFTAMGRDPQIDFIDMPEEIRDKYQYHTQADISKLRTAGYEKRSEERR